MVTGQPSPSQDSESSAALLLLSSASVTASACAEAIRSSQRLLRESRLTKMPAPASATNTPSVETNWLPDPVVNRADAFQITAEDAYSAAFSPPSITDNGFGGEIAAIDFMPTCDLNESLRVPMSARTPSPQRTTYIQLFTSCQQLKQCLQRYMSVLSQTPSAVSAPGGVLRNAKRIAIDMIKITKSLNGDGLVVPTSLLPVDADLEEVRALRPRQSIGKIIRRRSHKKMEYKTCHSCFIMDSCEWRRGPDGPRTLCNACGQHYAKMVSTENARQSALHNAIIIPQIARPHCGPSLAPQITGMQTSGNTLMAETMVQRQQLQHYRPIQSHPVPAQHALKQPRGVTPYAHSLPAQQILKSHQSATPYVQSIPAQQALKPHQSATPYVQSIPAQQALKPHQSATPYVQSIPVQQAWKQQHGAMSYAHPGSANYKLKQHRAMPYARPTDRLHAYISQPSIQPNYLTHPMNANYPMSMTMNVIRAPDAAPPRTSIAFLLSND